MATGRNHLPLKQSSQYKYVRMWVCEKGVIKWTAGINGKTLSFGTEKEAALYIDKQLIITGKSPINILVRKNN